MNSMQLYAVTWQFEDIELQKAAYAKYIEYMEGGAEMDNFEGFELLTRVHMPQTGQGIVICKAADEVALFKHFAPWRAMFGVEFNIQPAFTSQKVVNCHKELFAALG